MLNSSQKKAVEILDKPLVVIAGPGTGKTTLITEKINHLISKKKYKDEEILAITFTNKAAEEMSTRVEELTSKPFMAKTFHQFCSEIIEDFHKYIPHIDKNYTLINDTAQLLFFLETIDDIKFNSIEIKNNYHLVAYELQSTISKLKDFGYNLKEFEKYYAKNFQAKLDVLIAYSKYEAYKKHNNFVDFGDLQLYVYELLNTNKKVLEEIQKKYKYILVDEFQDTNKIQLDIIKLISTKNNITIVGDSKQSIYQFRGANFANLNNFKTSYPGFQEVFLNENYRSSKAVLETVNSLTQKIASKDEILKIKSQEKGFVDVIEAKTEKAQFSFIVNKILKILDKDPQATIGLLFRRKVELRQTAKYLKNFGIQFNSFEAMNFFDLPIIKSILEQLKIISNPKESNVEIFNILINYGISPLIVRAISRKASLNEKSIFEVLENNEFSKDESEQKLIADIYEKINELVKFQNSKTTLSSIVRKTIFAFNNYENAIYKNSKEDVFAINKFIEFADECLRIYKNNDLKRFLQVCDNTKGLDIEYGEEQELKGVQLMTIHASKGKEFDNVIIPYFNDRKFPTTFKRSKFEIFEDNREEFLDEELRLFYVALSRAKKELYISYVKRFSGNKYDSRASNFIKYIDTKKTNYDKEVEEYQSSTKDKVKIEILIKIKNFVLENKYDLAKKEMEMLEALFVKKGLNRFISDAHPQFDYYKNKLNGKEQEYNIEVNKNKMIYSVSQLKTYENCPKKYLYSYVFKVPSESKHYFDFGTSVHSVVEDLVDDMDKYSDDVLFARAVSMLRTKWISKGYLNSSQERDYFENGLKSIKTFIKTQRQLKQQKHKTIAKEKKFLIEVEGRKITGFIDRIDDVNKKIEILDYKTSMSMENEKQLKDNLQLYVYSLAAKKEFPKQEIGNVGLWYLVYDKIVKIKETDINTKELHKKMIDLMRQIEQNNFTPTPSFFACNYCDYKQICKDSK